MAHKMVKIETSQKLRNDHDLFLETYERPTQIYRFLKARSSLRPLFLQRNLSYMKSRKRKSKRNRLSLSKLIQTVEEIQNQGDNNNDVAQQIKSDCHLSLSFESIQKSEDFIRVDQKKVDGELFTNGTMMDVEVSLYRFKHPTPEALVTSNPNSLSNQSISLGTCTLPYSTTAITTDTMTVDNASPLKPTTLSIPGSVLSWKGCNGVMGTHMLVFRVSPAGIKDHASEGVCTKKRRLSLSLNKKNKSATSTTPGCPAPSPPSQDTVYLNDNHLSSLPNGIIDNKPLAKKKTDLNSDKQKLPENCVIGKPGRKPKRKLAVTKTLKPPSSNNCRRRRSQFELLIDHCTYNNQHKQPDHPPVPDPSSSDEDPPAISPLFEENHVLSKNSRKRSHSSEETSSSHGDPAPSNTRTNTSNGKGSVGTNECGGNGEGSVVEVSTDVYCAELVAFDSRQECLLANGEYELILQSTAGEKKQNGAPSMEDDMDTCGLNGFSLFNNRDTLFSFNNELCAGLNKSLTLKFTAKWTPDPPKPRTKDMAETAFELLKLRKSYELACSKTDGIDNGVDRVRAQPRCPTPCPVKPTVFNFMYNDDRLQQTELKENFSCPWCSLDCKQLYSLLKHLTLCHPRFKFTYNLSDEGLASVDVQINKHYDTLVSITDPVEMMGREALGVRKRPTKLKPTTALLVTKCDSCESFSLSEFTPRSQLLQFRTFYHSQSCLPMLPGESDSEEEGRSDWLEETSRKMVDEFVDVNSGEKEFMKIWNSYVTEKRVIAEKQLPQICICFAKEKLSELQDKNILYTFLSHVIYIAGLGLVPPTVILEINSMIIDK